MTRKQMLEKIAEAIEKVMDAHQSFSWQEADICASAALKACEDAGMLPPCVEGGSKCPHTSGYDCVNRWGSE